MTIQELIYGEPKVSKKDQQALSKIVKHYKKEIKRFSKEFSNEINKVKKEK